MSYKEEWIVKGGVRREERLKGRTGLQETSEEGGKVS